MKNSILLKICCSFILAGSVVANYAQAELIVLAAPADDYYADVVDDIFDFHVNFINQIQGRDDVVIFVGEDLFDRYAQAIGEDKLIPIAMPDIWMRDFSLSNTADPIMFRYTAAGQGGNAQGQTEADYVQEQLAIVMEDAGLSFKETDLLNDGGNFVDDYAGRVVVSRKFLKDNRLSEEKSRQEIKRVTKARYVSFIDADEQGGLEHADGVVSFVDANKAIINSYGDEDPEYASDLKKDLVDAFPGIEILEIITPYDGSDIYDKRFGSACGLYTNALVTPERIYFPQFGIPEDKIALKQLRSFTTKEIIPVSSHQVCHMGGGVRCMSWQLRGKNAKLLQEYKLSDINY